MTIQQTSLEAFDVLRHTGKLGKMQRQVYNALRELGPSTNRELAEYLGKDTCGVGSRTYELRHEWRAVRRVGTRSCKVTGRRSIIWQALE